MATLNASRPTARMTARMAAAYTICRFANGNCSCLLQQRPPCDSIRVAADAVIAAAKEELAEKYVLRKRPISSKP